MYAQADYVYKGLRYNDSDKELQYWDGSINAWKEARFNMHLSGSNKVKCSSRFKLRHNSRTWLYAPIKKATPISSLKPTCEPLRVEKTIIQGFFPTFNEVVEYIINPQHKSRYPIDFYIVDQNNIEIENVTVGSKVYMYIINNGDSLLRAHLVGHREGEDANYDYFDDENKKNDKCVELLLLPHSGSVYEIKLDKFVGKNEYMLVSYKAPKSVLAVEKEEDGSLSYSCTNEGEQVNVLKLMAEYYSQDTSSYNVVFNFLSFKTIQK